MHKVTIKVTIAVAVDVDGWNAEYGGVESVADIRENVQSTAKEAVTQAFAHVDAVSVR